MVCNWVLSFRNGGIYWELQLIDKPFTKFLSLWEIPISPIHLWAAKVIEGLNMIKSIIKSMMVPSIGSKFIASGMIADVARVARLELLILGWTHWWNLTAEWQDENARRRLFFDHFKARNLLKTNLNTYIRTAVSFRKLLWLTTLATKCTVATGDQVSWCWCDQVAICVA